MANPLLDRVLPADLADNTQVIEYKGIIGDFERLREISAGELERVTAASRPRAWQELPVDVRLEFGWLDTTRELAVANGRIRASLPVVCQRCLDAFVLPVDTPVRIRFGGSDEATAEPADYEDWEVDERTFLLQDVVEESIVLALPLAPLHGPDTKCGRQALKLPESHREMAQPFADLRSRMAGKDN